MSATTLATAPERPAPIIAAYNPYTEDRAPVVLALSAAEITGSDVIAVAVTPWPMSDGFSTVDEFGSDAEHAATSVMQRLREDLGVQTQLFTDDSVPHGLQRFAKESHAGLIVAGSTRRGRAGRVLAGTTAERLLHGAPCPVALSPHGYAPRPLKTIATGFVDSPEGHDALAAAHALATRSGALLRVIAALHPSGGLDAAKAAGLRPQRFVMLEGRHRAEIDAALDRALETLSPGAEVERELHVDYAADVLLRVSEHVDLLVCGSRGYGPLRSGLLGGVSRRLVAAARCPVLVLPREASRPLDGLLDSVGSAAVR